MGARKVLLVAINNYPSQPLKGCINDSRQVEAALQQRFGFAGSDVQILRERDATKANIEKGLEWLISGSRDGDVLLFHYSGHGTQVADDGQDEWECRDECLVPYDHDWNNPLRDDSLHRYFDRVPLNANLTAIMDCCHSGTIDKVILEQFAASSTYIAPKQLSTPIDIVMQIQALQQRRDEEFRAQAAPQLRADSVAAARCRCRSGGEHVPGQAAGRLQEEPLRLRQCTAEQCAAGRLRRLADRGGCLHRWGLPRRIHLPPVQHAEHRRACAELR